MKQFILQYYIYNYLKVDKLVLFGIRNDVNDNIGMFNDWIGCIYYNELIIGKATTDPGIFYTKNPLNSLGAFHLHNGFHENIWTLDKHKGKYLALCNRANCNKQRGWRDRNRNFINDDKIEVHSHVGANLHYSNNDELIGYASAGCQVTNNKDFFDTIIKFAIDSKQEFFSYNLFTASEIPPNLLVNVANGLYS